MIFVDNKRIFYDFLFFKYLENYKFINLKWKTKKKLKMILILKIK